MNSEIYNKMSIVVLLILWLGWEWYDSLSSW